MLGVSIKMRFAVLAIIMVLFAGFFHIMFIMFDNVWYNDDNGVFKILPEKMNNSMSSETANESWNKTGMLRDAFGMGRVICIILVPVCICLEAVDKPRITG